VYAGFRRILTQYLLGVCRVQADTDPIFIACIHRSGGYQSDIHERMQGSADTIGYSLSVCKVRQILIGYSLSVCKGQADTDRIFIERMHGSGGFQYSLGVCMGQADTDPIFIGCMQGSAVTDPIFIGCTAGVRRITDPIFIGCMHGSADTDPIFIGCMHGSGGY